MNVPLVQQFLHEATDALSGLKGMIDSGELTLDEPVSVNIWFCSCMRNLCMAWNLRRSSDENFVRLMDERHDEIATQIPNIQPALKIIQPAFHSLGNHVDPALFLRALRLFMSMIDRLRDDLPAAHANEDGLSVNLARP